MNYWIRLCTKDVLLENIFIKKRPRYTFKGDVNVGICVLVV